ncbi:unnamed protein product [Paramecium sonneborni]|uniref:Uncharacterized protein n=1 Tax=Paramecium sonneborni TaxID=65129 RepID=A0A8S1PPG3_9CILI|nr:unnamed protein product [Paramecium sonneborni]
MGICGGTQRNRELPKQRLIEEPDLNDENVKRIKKQFEELTQLLETMSSEFKAITDSIIKLQESQQQKYDY